MLRRPGSADVAYSGRLDRLVVKDGTLSIVDFKLGKAPARPSAAHVAQLALYRAALRPLYPALTSQRRAGVSRRPDARSDRRSGTRRRARRRVPVRVKARGRGHPIPAVVMPAAPWPPHCRHNLARHDEVAFRRQVRPRCRARNDGAPARNTIIAKLWNVWRKGPRGRRLLVACAVVGGTLLAAQAGLAPAARARTPTGMVPYAHPVFKNGKRVLWHGAWRGKGVRPARGSVRSAPASAAAEAKAAAQPQVAQPQAARPFSILADPGDICASRMAKDFAAVLSDDGEAGRAIVGSTSPTGLAKVAKAGMADFAVVTLDSVVDSAAADPEWVKRTQLVARLAPETLEVIAPRDIKSIADLKGRSVSFGNPDSATAISAKMLFSRLGVAVDPMYEPAPEGLDALAAGKRAAVVALGAKDLQRAERLRRGRPISCPRHSLVDDAGFGVRSGASDRRRAPESRRRPERGRHCRRTDGSHCARRRAGLAARCRARPRRARLPRGLRRLPQR